MTDSAGGVQAEYSYSPYGERTAISETVASDFAFTGHYFHPRSGFALTLLRPYSAALGRFITRDPVAERGGINLFGYVSNSPIGLLDVFGGWGSTGSNSGGGSYGSNSGGGSGGSNSGGGSYGGNSSCGPKPGWNPPPPPPDVQRSIDNILKGISDRMAREAIQKAMADWFKKYGPSYPYEDPLNPTGKGAAWDELYREVTGKDAPEHPDPTQGTTPSDNAQRGAD